MCWFHCMHPTGREAKEVAEYHGEFPNKYYKCIEFKCCKCPKTEWEHKTEFMGATTHFTAKQVADLPLLQELLGNDKRRI